MKFIAIDLGTTFIKAAVIDVAALEIRDVRRNEAPRRIANLPADVVEIDPSEVLGVVRQLIDDLLSTTDSCQGILMCGQMGGLILLDADNVPTTPFISWQDRRTCRTQSDHGSYFQWFEKIVGEQKQTVLGNEVRPGLSPALLFYIQQTQPELLTESTIPVTLPDHIASSLCGARPVTEYTNSPGVVSIVDRRTATSLFQNADIPPLDWPELVDFKTCVGAYTSDGRSLPVYAATGDHQCSLAGTLLQTDELSINIATGSQVSLLTSDNSCDSFQLRPFFDGLWLKTITNIPAGRALTAILRLLTELSGREHNEPSAYDWNAFFQMAQETAATDVEVNLGLFPGAIPGPGLFGNLSESNLTVGHIARASLQQMATQYRQLSFQLDANSPWNRIAFSGGLAARSSLLRQLVSESLDADYRMAPTEDDALFGLMVLGRVIAGMEPDVMSAIGAVAKQLDE